MVANKISLTSLSGSNGVGYNNITGQFTDLFTFNNGLSRVGNTVGISTGIDGQILTMSGGIPTWTNPASVSSSVSSVFGRTGSILAVSGDYDSMLVTESGTNLYFTNARAQTALAPTIALINGTLTNLTNAVNTLSGIVMSST